MKLLHLYGRMPVSQSQVLVRRRKKCSRRNQGTKAYRRRADIPAPRGLTATMYSDIVLRSTQKHVIGLKWSRGCSLLISLCIVSIPNSRKSFIYMISGLLFPLRSIQSFHQVINLQLLRQGYHNILDSVSKSTLSSCWVSRGARHTLYMLTTASTLIFEELECGSSKS